MHYLLSVRMECDVLTSTWSTFERGRYQFKEDHGRRRAMLPLVLFPQAQWHAGGNPILCFASLGRIIFNVDSNVECLSTSPTDMSDYGVSHDAHTRPYIDTAKYFVQGAIRGSYHQRAWSDSTTPLCCSPSALFFQMLYTRKEG